jgi:pseudaminic acid cytidylyltransferase
MNIAVIPARLGSKRIPKKNIKQFCGKPMVAYSIEAAKNSGIFEDIIVSTDSPEIANIAKDYGASVPFIRPKELSDDFSTTDDVMAHATKWLEDNVGQLSAVCCIYATAPFIQKDDLLNAYKKFKTNKWSYVFSATTFPFPIQRAIKRVDGGGIEMFYPKHYETRSQDLVEAFHDAGQFYIGKPEAWINKEKQFSISSEMVILPRWRVQDIDIAEDWKNAEVIMKNLIK